MAVIYRKYNKFEALKFRFWLAHRHILQKLLKPYYKKKFAKYRYKNYYLAIDFDGTIVEDRFPDIGPGRTKIIQKLLFYYDLLESIDVIPVIILWTCRAGKYLDDAKDWANRFLSTRIRPKYFNENPERGHGSPKVFAHEYWDDCGRRIR